MSEIHSKKRITWIDVAKGIAMIFVLLSHYERKYLGQIGVLGYMFSVQMFFLLSGMFAKPEKYSFVEYIKRQSKALLVPYALFSAINIAFHCLFNRIFSVSVLKEYVISALLARRSSLLVAAMWFLPCLFVTSIIYKLLTMAVKNRKTLLVICFAISAVARFWLQEPILPFTANQSVRFIFYFAAGDVLYPFLGKISLDSFKQLSPKNKTILSVIFVLLTIYVCIICKREYLISISYELNFLFISAMAFRSFMIVVFMVVVSILLGNCVPLEKIGQNTLAFCCLESINRTIVNTAMAVSGIGFALDEPFKIILYNFIAMAVGYVLILIINRWFPFLLGKRKTTK